MKNKKSFENILKSKMDGLEHVPSDRLGTQLKHRLQAKKGTNFPWQKIILWMIGGLFLAFIGFQYFKSTNTKIPKQPVEEIQQANRLDTKPFHNGHKHRNGHEHHTYPVDSTQKEAKLLVMQTPKDIKNKPFVKARLQAKSEQKMIFLHAFNLDCSHCQKMQDSTLADEVVQAFLQDYFVKIDIDLKQIENAEVMQFYDIKTSPKFLFLNGDGKLVTIAGGFHQPEKFMDILEKAMEENAAGSYLDLTSRKRVNPTPDQLQKTHPLTKVLLPDNLLMEAGAANQLILINVFEKDCPNCERLETVTFKDKKVQEIMDTRFLKWTIDWTQAKNLGLLQPDNKVNIPITFIFSTIGIWLTKFEDFMAPKPFIKTLQQSLTRNATLPKDIQLLAAKVFPNPTQGPFKVAMKGQTAPLAIKIIDLQGKIILEQTKTDFSGQQEYRFDLTGQQGQFFIQFSQEKSVIYKKIVVQ